MSTATATLWKVDTMHSEVAFKVKHMMISTVTGHFDEFDINVESENADNFENAKVDVTINTTSINTKNKDRDNHLRSDDFFACESFPNMTFKSKSFVGDKLIGDLTIRDNTKEVVLDVDFNGIALDPYGQTKAGFEITGDINRKDFGLQWSAVTEAGSIVVSDKVKLVLAVQLVKQ